MRFATLHNINLMNTNCDISLFLLVLDDTVIDVKTIEFTCVYVFSCTRACTFDMHLLEHTHALTHGVIEAHMHAHTHPPTHASKHARTIAHTYSPAHTYQLTPIHTHTHTHTHARIHAHTRTRTHARTHAHTHL